MWLCATEIEEQGSEIPLNAPATKKSTSMHHCISWSNFEKNPIDSCQGWTGQSCLGSVKFPRNQRFFMRLSLLFSTKDAQSKIRFASFLHHSLFCRQQHVSSGRQTFIEFVLSFRKKDVMLVQACSRLSSKKEKWPQWKKIPAASKSKQKVNHRGQNLLKISFLPGNSDLTMFMQQILRQETGQPETALTFSCLLWHGLSVLQNLFLSVF